MADRNLNGDLEALPETQPHPAPIFDTGPHPEPLPSSATSVAVAEPGGTPGFGGESPPAAPVIVPGQYHFLKWWKLVLVLVAVWIPAAAIGLALFSWWYLLADKTPAVFVVLLYVMGCIVAGLLIAMVPDNPLASALAIAVMSAVFASAVAAAPLYGHYYCQVRQQQKEGTCLVGIIPY